MASSSEGAKRVSMASRPNVVFGADYGETVDFSRWVVMYTPYIDAKLKEREGRKIALSKCVDEPNALEVFDCAQLLGLQTAMEMDKAYCRDYWRRGRVRVRLFDENKAPVRPDIASRRVLYAKIAELIPEHRKRTEKAKKSSGSGGGGGGGGSASASGGGGAGGGGSGAAGAGGGGKQGGGGKGGAGGGAKVVAKKKKKGKR